MAYRCSECNRFVSTEIMVDTTECEEYDPDMGVTTLHVSVSKCCAECGTTVATAEIDLEVEIDNKKWEDALKQAEWEAE